MGQLTRNKVVNINTRRTTCRGNKLKDTNTKDTNTKHQTQDNQDYFESHERKKLGGLRANTVPAKVLELKLEIQIHLEILTNRNI